MNTTLNMRNAAVAAVVAALGAVAVYGITALGPDAPNGHFVVDFDGGAPTNCAIVEADVTITQAGFAALGIDSGPATAFARVEVSADDGGADLDQGDAIAGGGFIAAYTYPSALVCVDGGHGVEVWLDGRLDSPAHCACVPAFDAGECDWPLISIDGGDAGWAPAPSGVTLRQWSGACLPKVCTVLAGQDIWPAGCAR